MKKTILVIVLALLAAAGSSLRLSLNIDESHIRCSPASDGRILLDINIGELFTDPDASVKLPAGFDPYLSLHAQIPVLNFHIAIGNDGEYRANITGHQIQTEIPYQDGRSHGSQNVFISKPYRLRDIRGIDLMVYPYSSVDGKLMISDKLRVEFIRQEGAASEASPPPRLNPYFVDIYKRQFLNFDCRYEDIAEYGSMAVICPTTSYDAQTRQFRGLIQPWVDWKNQKGIPTTVYSTNLAGSTYDEIKCFIQNLYDTDPNLTFVQLVGDYEHIPCNVTTMFGNTGGMDAYYTLLQGDDGYPDIFLGRFSAETAADLYTQIKRSIDYEKGLTSGTWLSRAAGVCSQNPPIPGDDDEHNWEHLDNIRAQLLDFGYTQVDRIYDNEGAGTQDLIDSLNEGKSLVNYCGEGYPSHWVAPEFWISDAENLSNTDMLPFIHVVSCWTGQFYDGTCLAEALMRSRSANAAEARGAIAVYAAAPEQGISPPMEAQDHAMQLLVSGTKNTIGGLCYNGSNSMIDEYGEWGTYNFLAWNLFGDASLVLRTKPALQIDAILPIELPPYYANLDIDTGSPDIQVSLSRDGVHVISGFSDASGMAHLVFPQYPVPGDRYLLTLSGIDRIPLQRQLVCHPYGSHAVLDLRVLDSVQFIEPEVVISKTIIIQNLGSVPAQNIRVYLQSDDPNQYFVPVVGYQDLGEILPGEVKQAELSFRIGKGTPDMTTLYYSIMTNHHGYQIECIEVIKAPMIIVEEVLRSPQANWVNPGDSFSVILHIRNTGSVALRGLAGQLTPDSDFLQIVPQQTNLTINPGCTDSLVFSATLSPACPIDEIIGYSLLMDAQNGLGSSWWTWMVTAPGITVESFETRDFQTFPWVYRSDQWSIVNTNMDGLYGLRSEAVTADSVVLGLSFFSQREGSLSFRYSKYPSYSDTWSFRIDQVPVAELTSDNFSMSFDLSRGHHQISWVGKRDPAHAGFESNLWLDLIKFPSGTLFDNASLQADVSHLDITLAPGEIRKLPITLSSADGKCLLYSAVLQNATLRGGPGLYCNRNTFNPGTAELFLFTLHNVSPNGSIKNVSISLPDNVLASLASNFSSPGQITLPFTGNLGSMSLLNWESGNGSNADSLLAWVRLVIDADLEAIQLPYRIQYTDATGSPSELLGSIDLLSADSLNACLRISNAEGEIDDEEKAILFITANQNRMHGTQDAYTLKVYFNANHLLSIPINVTYDSDPPGFFDTPRLSGYPNPFRDQITFAYAVPQDGGIELLLYNLRGQKVRTLVSQDMAKGYYRTAWDACDDHGRRVGNGIYFCRIKTSAGLSRTIKCVVLK